MYSGIAETDGAAVLALVRAALAEDLGSGDVTTEATVAADAEAKDRLQAFLEKRPPEFTGT